ncbi:two-component system histidine kinase PnpS [Hutsoniella sourekii]
MNKYLNKKELTTLIILYSLVVIIMGLGARFFMHASIQMNLEREVFIHQQIINSETKSDLTYEAISKQLFSPVEPVQLAFVERESDQNHVLWNNFQNKPLISEIVKQYNMQNKPFLSGHNLSGYWVLTQLADQQLLIEFYPRDVFSRYFFNYWLFIIFIALLLLVFVIFICWFNFLPMDRKLHKINLSLKNILNTGESLEFIETGSPVLGELASTVNQLKEDLNRNHTHLITSEQRLSLLLDNINLGVVLVNPNEMIELYNPEAANLLQWDSDMLGTSYEVAIKSFLLVQMIDNVFADRQALHDEVEIYIPESRYVDVTIIPYEESGEGTGSILVLLYDISNIRRLETVRTEFVANASHELRTPVTAIKGFAETLVDGALQDPELAQQFVEIILKESNRLETLIFDILELSRVEKRSEPLIVEVFDLVLVVKQMIEFFVDRANRHQMTIHLHAPEAVYMKADQHRVEQVVTNLLDNALKYSNDGQSVNVTIEQRGGIAVITFVDYGIGIPAQDQERIFERFYRVDKGRSRRSGGTGLGLSIVKNLIRILKGSIDVESQLGKGSTFTVKLPLE